MRVFVLDAKGVSRDRMIKWLSESGTGMVNAFGEYGAFEKGAAKAPPDFCLIRLGADGIPGFRAAEAAKKANPDVRIVFVSDEPGYAVDAYEMGAYGYLLCPVRREKLARLLREVKK